MKIFIDPGHGGRDPGAVGLNNTFEKTIVLNVALELDRILTSRNLTDVTFSRETDIFIPLQKRATLSNENRSDLFLSIHCNAATNRDAEGVETFYWHMSKRQVTLRQNMDFAHAIQNSMMRNFPSFRNRGIKPTDRFTVIRRTNCNAALVELNFISNPVIESFMNTRQFVNIAAVALANGIIDYNIKKGD